MSTNDITLNTKVFSFSASNGRELIRTCSLATLPSGLENADLIISHQPGAGQKADRHLAKFNRHIALASGVIVPITLYAVLVVPKGLTKAQVSAQIAGDNSMSDDLSTLFSSDTYAFAGRFAHNEFS